MRQQIPVITDASGNATVFSESFSGTIKAIHWVKPASGGITGATFTITAEGTGESIVSDSSVSASKAYYPRASVHHTDGSAALFAAAGTAVVDPIALGGDRVKIVIASGGNKLSGTFHLVFDGSVD